MRDEFLLVGSEYLAASSESLAGHPVAQLIRADIADSVSESLSANELQFKVTGSPGQGNWAAVPWIGVFDDRVTTSATKGYYVVYLFSADMNRLYLSLNQGTTVVREEFGARYEAELQRRAALIQARLPEHSGDFSDDPINLSSTAALPRGYEAGHAFGVKYDLNALPTEEVLQKDLVTLSRLYLRLIARGGLDTIPEEGQRGSNESLVERRRYTLHRKIERNSRIAKKAKQIHGTVCQGCEFDFEAVYGELGRGYIEAHHLVPLASLPEDVNVPTDPEHDFAVLCANCHRMIHRTEEPGDLSAFRTMGALAAFRKRLT